jgi:glycerol uptake facilitator-like aquaporin
MGERLSAGNIALALPANSLATGATLVALFLAFGPGSSAHFKPRSGAAQLLSAFIATSGLLAVIWGCARMRSPAVPFAVGSYITGAAIAVMRDLGIDISNHRSKSVGVRGPAFRLRDHGLRQRPRNLPSVLRRPAKPASLVR